MNAIQIKNVSHRYGNNAALEDVTLSIPSGATVGLMDRMVWVSRRYSR